MEFVHAPVLFKECMEMLNLKKTGVYVDGTMGGAGHSRGILERTFPEGRLIAVDQDPDAIKAGRERLSSFGERVTIVHSNFGNLKTILKGLKINQIDGILFDLGVSSYQLDNPERGFSYMDDAPLDMRMNSAGGGITAADLVNSESEANLARIIFTYGEERWAKRIARFIVESRAKNKITTTGELVQIIKNAVPAGARKSGPHPAKRTFQALRIAVNKELDLVESAIGDAVGFLKPGGRICVISFHSLEDRIVKQQFQRFSAGCICPPGFPVCRCGVKPLVKIITKKPVVPTDEEVKHNPRARSAKLRVAEKVLNIEEVE